ncbi:MAG: tyrosine-type recombinase/integrase [Candidatus Dormibacteria bacterium]
MDDTFEDLLDAFTTHLKEVRCLSFGTQDSYTKSARTYYRWLVATEPAAVLTEASPATIRAYVTFKRAQKISPGTIATYLQALKRFYEFLFLDDPDRPNPTKGVRGPKVIEAPIDPLTEDEVRLLLTITQHHEHSDDLPRWVGYVALTILAGTGVRNAELRDLLTDNIDLTRRQLKVIGKGSKVRIIPFGPATAQVLATYLEGLRPRLAPSAYFIVNPLSLRNGPNWGRMGEKSLVDLLKVLLTEAEISGKANPHRFRHSYATLTTSKTGNVELTRQLMGHSDITTTSRYIHTAMKDRHDAADGVDLVPVSDVTDPIEPNGPEMPSPSEPLDLPVTTATASPENLPEKGPRVGLVPFEHPAPSQALLARDCSQDAHVGRPQGGPHREDLRGATEDILADAVGIARHLPPQLLVHLNSERLVEVALGSLITTGLNTEVFLAAAGAVLSWAHGLPLPLNPLLATYGTDVADALLQVRRTLELLSGLDPSAP